MNKILVIKHKEGYGNISADSRMKIAKSIADIWDETGIIAIPFGWDYKLEDCDKFMGIEIDKEIADERLENGCKTWTINNPWGVSIAPLVSTTAKE